MRILTYILKGCNRCLVSTLTTNIDTFGNAAQTSQQIFNAANGTFTSLDNLTGGTATNDTLNVAVTGAYTTPVGVTVANVDIINITASTGAVVSTATAATGFTGVRALNVITAAGVATVTAASTTAITVTNATPGAVATTVNGGSSVSATVTGAVTSTLIIGTTTAATGAVTASLTTATTNATGGVVTVTGGTTVAVTSLVSNTAAGAAIQATTGTVTVTGSALTTAVTVNQSAGNTGTAAVVATANTSNAVAATRGVTNGIVTISDATATAGTQATTVGTITTVTLQNYGASTIASNALTTLNLSTTGGNTTGGAADTLGLTYGLTTGGPTALALNLGGGSLGVVTDASNVIATLNTALTASTTLGGFAGTALRTVNLSGTGVLTLTATNTAITSIVNTSAAAGLNADVSALTGLTSLNFASTSANNTITLNAARQSYVGGTGNDIVTIGADALVAITGGTGTDTIVLSNTAATYTNANYRTNVTGFETLQVTNIAGLTYSMSTFTGFSNIQVNSAGATIGFSNVVAGTGLQLLTDTVAVTYTLAGTNGAASTVNVGLNGTAVAAANGGGTAGFTTTALTLQDANGVGVGTVNINSDASVFGGLHTITTLTTSALSNLNFTGTGSLSITNAATSQTSLTISDNATGIQANSGTADGIGTLTSTGSVLGQINYSGTHAFTTTLLVDNVANLTIANANTGTSGVFTVAGHTNTLATAATLTLTGSVAYTGNYAAATGAMTVSGATDNSIVNLTMSNATGIKTVTLGNGANIVVTGGAADVITVGTGGNTITGAAGGDVVTLGAGTASSAIVYSAVAQTIQGAVTSGTTALTAAAGADRVIGATAGDTINLTAWGAGLFTAGALSTTINAGGAAIDIVRGNWVAATGIFTSSATGTDSIVQWDTDGAAGAGVIETVVLVGFVNTASTTTVNGLITLA